MCAFSGSLAPPKYGIGPCGRVVTATEWGCDFVAPSHLPRLRPPWALADVDMRASINCWSEYYLELKKIILAVCNDRMSIRLRGESRADGAHYNGCFEEPRKQLKGVAVERAAGMARVADGLNEP